MTELKISDSTQAIIEKYKVDIEAAESALNIARKAANDILNIILFEAHLDPNQIENLQILDRKLTFDLKDENPELTAEIDKIPNT